MKSPTRKNRSRYSKPSISRYPTSPSTPPKSRPFAYVLTGHPCALSSSVNSASPHKPPVGQRHALPFMAPYEISETPKHPSATPSPHHPTCCASLHSNQIGRASCREKV